MQVLNIPVFVAAQQIEYFEKGGTLSLKPDVSIIPRPITYILWSKVSDWVVEWEEPDDMRYFGTYENRTRLNIETLQLDIYHLTLADSGTFSLETDEGTVGTYQVKVIRKCVCYIVCVLHCVCYSVCVCYIVCYIVCVTVCVLQCVCVHVCVFITLCVT